MLPRTLRSWDVCMSSLICWSKLYFSLLRLAFLNLCHWLCEPSAQCFKKCFILTGNGIMHSWKKKKKNFSIKKMSKEGSTFLQSIRGGGWNELGKRHFPLINLTPVPLYSLSFSLWFSSGRFQWPRFFSQHNPKEDPWYKYRAIKILWEKKLSFVLGQR